MSVETIRVVLGTLQDNPESDQAWNELAEAVTAPGVSNDDAERLLGMARAKHEERREWSAVSKLLDLELSFARGTAVEAPMQAELARIYSEELCDVRQARAAYTRLLELVPGDAAATEAIASADAKLTKWRDLVARYISEAEGAGDDAFKSALYASAAEVAFRYGGAEESTLVLDYVAKAASLDKSNARAAKIAELVHTAAQAWAEVAEAQSVQISHGPDKAQRLGAALRMGRVARVHLRDPGLAATAYELALDLSPGHRDAVAELAKAYGETEQWDHLVTLFEDQLRAGADKKDELGVLVQLAMVHWRMRGNARAAEPFFERVRRADPTHAGMLAFFREVCTESGDEARLATVLSDAQRATNDPALKASLAGEVARLAEAQENAGKAIEQYKAVLRSEPANVEAREALKRLYLQTDAYNPLIDVYRQQLEHTPADDAPARIAILREVATIYRDHVKNDSARVTALTQIVQLDEADIEAIRELTRVYETLGRHRDLLVYQQKLAELSTNPAEKAALYRSAARRWTDQFSNVQNAIAAYEGVLSVEAGDVEAQQKLRELYHKRRAWPQLYALYEQQLPTTEGAERLELLGEMARLAAERLDRGAEAISLYKQVLEADASAEGVLDALEKQAERDKDYATVAEVLERRIASSDDEQARLAWLQKLGAVYSDRLKDSDRAAQTWRRVLELAPKHSKATRVLRDLLVGADDYDGLEQLYVSQDDVEGLAEYLSSAADKAKEVDQKVELSFRAARVYVENLEAPERAARSYERVLTALPGDTRAAAALAPIYEQEEKWARLPALYEILLANMEDTAEQVAMLRKLAAVSGGPLADKTAALGYAARAYELQPDADGLDLLEAWSRATSEWQPFIVAIESRLKRKKGLTQALKRQLRLKTAEVYAQQLGKLDEAVAIYRELVEAEPTDTETIGALEAILRASDRRDDLRWLLQLRADQAGDEGRATALEEWASLEEDVFGEPERATALYRKVIEAEPSRVPSLRALSRLLNASGDHAGAATTLASLRDASDGRERARLELELARLYAGPLTRPSDALDACIRALEIEPGDSAAIDLISGLVERPETRQRAAAELERHFADAGDGRREAQALNIMLEAKDASADERKALFTKLADVEELKLKAAGRALDVVLRALTEFADDMIFWDRAAELTAVAGRPTDLAEAYRVHLLVAATGSGGESRGLPEHTLLELCERAAALHDDTLGDPEGAMPYLTRVLAVTPTNRPAFERLKQILTSSERWGELEDLYDRAAQATTIESERIELLGELALIAEEIIGDPNKAIGYYERILALDPLYEAALDALEKLYERQSRFADLATLIESRIETATEAEAIDYELFLGKLYVERLDKPEQALTRLEDVLNARESDPDARALVERLLDNDALRVRAATVLTSVYESRDEVRSLVRVLDIRREASVDEHEKREFLRRVSVLRDERLRDDAGAFAALAELIPLEPEDASLRDRFVEIGRRLGEHETVAKVLTRAADACVVPATSGEILAEVATIAQDYLADTEQAERVYRRIVELDPTDPVLVMPAARALADIYTNSGDYDKLAAILELQSGIEQDGDVRRALHERLGTLYETELKDPKRAIATYRVRLGDDPSDESALAALERLYEATEDHEALVGALREREQVATDTDERRRVMLKAAEILAAKVGDLPGAIEAYRAVLDDFGPDSGTLGAIGKLYEKSEDYDSLIDALETELTLAEQASERVGLLVRLGELRKTRREDLDGALEAYREALSLDPSDAACRSAISALLEIPEARREAAAILIPLYEVDGDSERLLHVLDIEVEAADSAADKLETLRSALRTAEGPLSDAKRAFAYALRGVEIAAGEDSITEWVEIAERIGAATEGYTELCLGYQAVVDEVLDGEAQQNMRLRIGELATTRLDDPKLAIESYKRAHEAEPDDLRPLLALETLYASDERASDLLSVLELRAAATEDEQERRSILYRIAELRRGPLEDASGAITTYESILELGLDAPAIAALSELYTAAERWPDIISLYERRLDEGNESAADLHVKVAALAHRKTGDIDRAFDELAAAFEADAAHEAAISEAEALLATEEPAHRARAAELLEPVYLRRADWSGLKSALEARLADSQDPGDRRDLLTRLATLHEEQLEDFPAALETVALLLHEDLGDEAVWSELERLAKVASAEKRLAAIYGKELEELPSDDEQSAKLAQRTGEIHAELGDVTSALAWYRRAHAFDPESRELFDAIDALLTKESRHEERVALYRAHLDYRDEADRVEGLHTVAALERGPLASPETAVDTYRAVLDVDNNDARALDALTELYGELGRDRDLADLHASRADLAASGEEAAPYRLQLARLLATKLDDPIGALDQLEAIVSDVPWHDGAIAQLEKLAETDEHKARAVEILRPLYERKDDWRLLVQLNEQRLELATDIHEKIDVLRETAALWETRGDDRARAFAAYKAAFALDAEDASTRADLERLAGGLGSWEELAQTYEEAVASSEDEHVRRGLLTTLSSVYDEQLDDPRRALEAHGRVVELDATDSDALEAMVTLAMLLGDWAVLVSVLSKQAELGSDDETAAIFRRIGDIKLEMLLDEEGARVAYERAIELDPEHAATLDSLIDIYEARDDSARLVDLYARRVERAADAEADLRHDLRLRAAKLYEDKLEDRHEAITTLTAALDERPSDAVVLSSLERLYRAEAMHDELLENLKQQAALADSSEARTRLRNAVADLYAKELESPSDALEQYRLVLDEAPTDEHAIAATFAIGSEQEDLRREAAGILEPVLRAAGRSEDLVRALRLRLGSQSDATERASTLRSIALVSEEQLEKPEDALSALIEALDDTPEDATIHEDIERLAAKTRGFARYADAMDQRASSTFDATVGADLWRRIGRIAESQLEDPKRAVEAFAKAAEHAGDEPELLVALDRLHGKLGDHTALADVLERRIAASDKDSEQADLYHRLAILQIEQFGEQGQGLTTLRMALERAVDHEGARQALEKLTDNRDLFEEAAEALEEVYRSRGDNDALAKLHEKRIGFAELPSDRLRMRLDLAHMLEDRAGDVKSAQRTLENALSDDVTDEQLLSEIERVAPITGAWASAADALEAAIGAQDLTMESGRDLYMRLATWRKDRCDDVKGAEAALRKALARDPASEDVLRRLETFERAPGREADLIVTLRKLAAIEGGDRAVELRREAKTVAECNLEDLALSEEIVREMLEANDADAWALAELTSLREKAGDFKEAFDLYVRRADIEPEGAKVSALRHAAATIAREKLSDEPAAIALLEQLFEDNPTDAAAATELRGLYTSAGKSNDLLTLIGRLIDMAESAEVRATLRIECARICLEKLGSTTEAIEHLVSVLDEDAGHAKASLMLSELYEKEGRDDELAELLTAQVELAKERGDRTAELDFSVRLGDVAESRLHDVPKAIATYRAVLDRDDKHPKALASLARLHEAQGETAEAAAMLERILREQSSAEAVKTATHLADLYAKQKDGAAVRRSLEAALAAAPSDAAVRERLSAVYESEGAWAELAKLIEGDADLATEPVDKVRLYRKGAAIHTNKRKDPAAAADLLVKATELEPSDRELLLALCDAYSACGRGQQAIDALQQIVESYGGRRSKDLGSIHLRMARAYLGNKDKAQALAELEVAFKSDPGSMEVLRELGLLSLEMADETADAADSKAHLDRAHKTFRALLLQRFDDSSPITKAEVFYYIGLVAHRQGDKKTAMQQLQRAIDNDKDLAVATELLAELKG